MAARKTVSSKRPRKSHATKEPRKTTKTTQKKASKRKVTWRKEFCQAILDSNKPAICFALFARLCKEVLVGLSDCYWDWRMQRKAIEALLEASKAFLL
ncbi:hypothetical protein F53441_11664 [Fusarium austroafricanum]|uniref:Histone H3 n=1 Tax=Fusarium austroafricanum TaxID=2364996 RepID=A0A8H4NLI6_9HYPO|nr:hypothetical protein F53441_11664 [Fusarium austroafricanum]